MNVLRKSKSITTAAIFAIVIFVFALVGQASIKFESGQHNRKSLNTLGLGNLRGFKLAEDLHDNQLHLVWSSESFRLKWHVDTPKTLGSAQPIVIKFSHGSVYNYLLLQGIVEELTQEIKKKDPSFGLRSKVPTYIGKEDLIGTTDIRVPNSVSGRKFLRKLAKEINKLNDRF